MKDGKSILITSTDVMMFQFLVPYVNYLALKGFHVDVACSSAELYEKEGYFKKIKESVPAGCKVYHIRTKRNPFDIHNIDGLIDLKRIINIENYNLIWTNEPVMGVMTRVAAIRARRHGTKVMYMAHGYHFFKGASVKNWVFYPIEKLMSHFCDAIVVINWEDYYLTKNKFNIPVFHINGIGVELNKFSNVLVDKKQKRKELGINDNEVIVISVGELQTRKNQEVALRAIAKLSNKNVRYILCGTGELKDRYINLSKELGIENQVKLLGHRYDVPEILAVSDIFVHPSQREGFGISVIEAMAVGLPLVTSNVQGIKDYMVNGVNGYMCNPFDVSSFTKAIKHLVENPSIRKKMSLVNIEKAKQYSVGNSIKEVDEVIQNILKPNNKTAVGR